ncbi:MAG TPA: SusC/RagA family TonB-linked outer membrane protein [Chitinophagaceae bacterium]|nr:SusC/RagA family TonB-linked outer membrane protein [Chitinophagaceae bacterium]
MKRTLLSFACLMIACAGFGQSILVTGKVTSAKDGSSQPGVTVVQKGTTTGTASTADGTYSITVPGDATLVFSQVGDITQEIPVNGRTKIDVALKENAKELSAVVVTALGIKREKRSLGYSMQEIQGSTVERSNAPNVVNALAGKVASVNISTPNGVDGGSTRIVIDGNNSIGLDNQPLIIVDGVPMENDIPADAQSPSNPKDWGSPINLVNSYDIESMSVLKGPAAAALYGGRGANGVIIITTKKGTQRQGLGVDYTFSYKVDQPYRFLKVQNRYGAGGMVSLNKPAYQTDANGKPILTDGWTQLFVDQKTGSGPYGVNSYDQVSWPGSGSSWGPQMNGTMITWWDGKERPDDPQPDNMRLLYQNGTQATHHVSISGGNEWGTLRASYTRLDNTAILPNSGYNQNTMNLGSNIQISKRVNVTLSASYYINVYHNAPQLGNNDASSWQKRLLYNVGRNYKGLDIQQYKNPDGTQNALTNFPWIGNGGYMIWNLMENNEWKTRRKLLGSAQFDYKATDFLDIMFRAGLDANNDEDLIKHPPTDNTGLNGGDYEHGLSRDNTTDFVGMASFHKEDIAQSSINAKLSVGAEAYERKMYGVSGKNGDWSVPDFYNFSTFNGNPNATTEATLNTKLNSLYGLLNLSYKEFLYLDITGRNDWSSTLPPSEWSYFFPSASASFVFSDALHINPSVLSFGKLRAAWAQAAVSPVPYFVNYAYTAGSFGGQLATSLPTDLPALHYKPQINTTEDIGLTLGFLKSRITVDLRYYYGRTKNQIIHSPLPLSSGAANLTVSEGVLENSGYELTLNARVVDRPGFKWDIALNASHNNNKLLSLAPGVDRVDLGSIWGDGGAHGPDVAVKVGDQYGTIYGYDYTYYNNVRTPSNRIFIQDPFGKAEMSGAIYQATDSLVPIGNATPKIIAGMSNTFTFAGGLSVSFLMDCKLGGDVWSGTYATMMQQGLAPETLKERDGGGLPYTTPDGEKTNWGVLLPGKFPDGTVNTKVVHYYYKYMQYGVWSSSANYGNDWIDGTSVFKDNWIKMREIDINYNLPDRWIHRTKVFQAASISLVGRNLFYLYSSLPDNINPEGMNGAGNAQGLEFASLPSYRSFGFQVRLSF